jgi:hypothetical protein
MKVFLGRAFPCRAQFGGTVSPDRDEVVLQALAEYRSHTADFLRYRSTCRLPGNDEDEIFAADIKTRRNPIGGAGCATATHGVW